MGNINYSFIIPHKNCPNLLKRCLDSIPKRSDIQIIVVDDNSSDDKVEFSDFPGLGEDCVEVYFTKEGKGAGFARNIGLKHAKGKWLVFADADDFFVKDCIDVFDRYVDDSINDIIYFKVVTSDKLSSEEYDISSIDDNRAKEFNMVLNSDKKKVLLSYVVPWSKMIRRDIVIENNISFDEIICANDVMFSVRLFDYVRNIKVSDERLYCVTRPTSRNLTSKKDFKSGKTRLSVLLARNSFLKKRELEYLRHPPLLYIWEYRHTGLKSIFQMLWMIIASDSSLFIGFRKFLKNPQKYLK